MSSSHLATMVSSEEAILDLLKKNAGSMTLSDLIAKMSEAGLVDKTFVKSAIWHLISRAKIDREADRISLAK